MNPGLDALKRSIFYDLLELAGRVFIQVRFSDRVRIGTRGFLPEEKNTGLVLVFNRQMKFAWDEEGITATLVFGAASQKCFIPAEDILSVFSPDLQAQFSVRPSASGDKEAGEQAGRTGEPSKEDKVVRVDFRKKNQ